MSCCSVTPQKATRCHDEDSSFAPLCPLDHRDSSRFSDHSFIFLECRSRCYFVPFRRLFDLSCHFFSFLFLFFLSPLLWSSCVCGEFDKRTEEQISLETLFCVCVCLKRIESKRKLRKMKSSVFVLVALFLAARASVENVLTSDLTSTGQGSVVFCLFFSN